MLVLAYTDSFLFLLERLMTPVIIREAASTSALSTLRVKTGATASPPLYCGSPSWKFWRSRTIHFWRSRSVISSSPVKPSTGGDKAAEAFLAISKEMVINGTVNEIARNLWELFIYVENFSISYLHSRLFAREQLETSLVSLERNILCNCVSKIKFWKKNCFYYT